MISILLATYNGERYIKESVSSVLNQTFSEFELLIGLNGEQGNTLEILSQFDDKRIKIIDFNNDRGKAKTLNKLLKMSNYDYICIQDDDDIWLEEKLEKQLKFIYNFDVVGTYINYINESSNIIGGPKLAENNDDIIEKSLWGVNQVANTSVLMKKDCIIKVGGWRENLDGIEDFDLWLRLMRQSHKFYNVPEVLVLHRLHNQSNFNTKKFDLNSIL